MNNKMKQTLTSIIALLLLASCSPKACDAYNNYPTKPKQTIK